MNWRWVSSEILYAIHDRQVAQHGGLDGIGDANALAAALARPQNPDADGTPDAAALAAAYAYGIARNHGFADGNKRTAWVIARLFLADNNYILSFAKQEAVKTMLDVAAGAIAEDDLASWFRDRLTAK